MKTTKKMLVGILALALVLTFAGCGGDGGGGGGGTGNNLSISNQQVYEMEDWSGATTAYTGSDMTVTSNVGGSGNITAGKLSFSIGTPNKLEPLEDVMAGDDMDDVFSYFSFSPSSTQGAALNLTTNAGELTKATMSLNMLSMSMSIDVVSYNYVDRDCTITAPAGTYNIEDMSITIPNTNLSLKTGWNTILIKVASTNIMSNSGTANFSVSDSSSCKWTLDFSY